MCGLGVVWMVAGGCAATPSATRTPLPTEYARVDGAAAFALPSPAGGASAIASPCVVRWGRAYRMLYTAPGESSGARCVERAESDDGLKWTRRAGVVLAFGDGRTSIAAVSVVRDPGGDAAEERIGGARALRGYVVAADLNADEPEYRLYRTSSTDGGVTWAPLDGPVMDNVCSPYVVRDGRTLRMWYADTSERPWAIRSATSDDGVQWSPATPEPVLTSTAIANADWEKGGVTCPVVLHEAGAGGGRWLMWYEGLSEDRTASAIGLAVSDDGVYWRKLPASPVLPAVRASSPVLASSLGHSVLPVPARRAPGAAACGAYRVWHVGTGATSDAAGVVCATSVPYAAPGDRIEPPPAFVMSAAGAPDRRVEPLVYLKQHELELRPRYTFDATTSTQWRAWQTACRAAVVDAIGLPQMTDGLGCAWNDRANLPLRVTAGPVDACDGYTRHALTIETAPGLYVPAFLLVPTGVTTPRPAILCAHGHGLGMNDLVGLDEAGHERKFGEGYQHDFAIQAVRAGFVALAYDQMGFGRRRDMEYNKRFNLWNSCEQPSKNGSELGVSMTGMRVWDAIRMVDFLQSRPEVRADRIGMVGISGGGLVTEFTAAIDERIGAACVSGFCNTFGASILGVNHCIDNYVQGLLRVADNDDVACLVAPRALLIEAGTKDPIFPIAATRAALRKLERCYGVAGVADRVEADIFDRGHEFSGARTWTFFAAHLGTP